MSWRVPARPLNGLTLYARGDPAMTATRDLDISPSLQQCSLRTETACVRECCGLDAFEPDRAVICAWAKEVGSAQTMDALREVRDLIAASADRTVVVSSMFLNACTPDEPSREKLVGFLKEYEAALAACA